MTVNISGMNEPLECLETVTGESYRGRVNVTQDGVACQKWNSRFPHM